MNIFSRHKRHRILEAGANIVDGKLAIVALDNLFSGGCSSSANRRIKGLGAITPARRMR